MAPSVHRGIKLLLSFEGLCRDNSTGQWRFSNYKSGETPQLSAGLIGLVRYEAIESVNWNGDEYYGYPHIYGHFTEKGQKPYERLVYCEARNRATSSTIENWLHSSCQASEVQ